MNRIDECVNNTCNVRTNSHQRASRACDDRQQAPLPQHATALVHQYPREAASYRRELDSSFNSCTFLLKSPRTIVTLCLARPKRDICNVRTSLLIILSISGSSLAVCSPSNACASSSTSFASVFNSSIAARNTFCRSGAFFRHALSLPLPLSPAFSRCSLSSKNVRKLTHTWKMSSRSIDILRFSKSFLGAMALRISVSVGSMYISKGLTAAPEALPLLCLSTSVDFRSLHITLFLICMSAHDTIG
mmetsp:Transcript_32197/g.56527  ORF Transcript_32197/g.56527 Transcript_32197/m.56527 type:complete len:246 (+) Transcript_32197:2-739(+)